MFLVVMGVVFMATTLLVVAVLSFLVFGTRQRLIGGFAASR